jgi:hypothetical protein
MKTLVFLTGCLLSLSAFADTAEISREIAEQGACQVHYEGQQTAQQGCCSWHGGVCGCQGGRVVCCDGRYSPSCGCNKEDQSTNATSENEA